MKQKFLILMILLTAITSAQAKSPKEGMDFFNLYTNYANSYNEALLGMYSPDVKIIREVVKPTGETEDVVLFVSSSNPSLKLCLFSSLPLASSLERSFRRTS